MTTTVEMAFQDYFSNNVMKANKKRIDGALKRYESIEDPRCYSMDKKERADFILGIVKRSNVSEVSDTSATGDGMSQSEMIKKIQSLVNELKVCGLPTNDRKI